MSRIDEIAARHAAATPAVLSMHQEMLDICNGDFSDRDAAWFYTWIAEWFNTIKQHWPFEDIAYLTAELAAQTARADRAEQERDRAIDDINSMALAMRESEELSVGCCFACICENLPEDCILPYGECPGYERDDCFEWRGLPQEGE